MLELCQSWALWDRRGLPLYLSYCGISAVTTVWPDRHIYLLKSSYFEESRGIKRTSFWFWGWHFEPHFRPPLLEDASHSSYWAAWAQKTSVPHNDKPADVRDLLLSKSGRCTFLKSMKASWTPWKSPRLPREKKDYLSMTVLGPFVIDLRGVRNIIKSSIPKEEFRPTSNHFMTMCWKTKILFCLLFPSTRSFFWQVVMVTYYRRPGWILATDTKEKSWLNLHLHYLPSTVSPALCS